ncbi:MAG TPA: LamG-like jellyroll fold domain-containing protein [Verrucomicrobiae bacterium]|nr:LamG-like jellyroll fold domain-containing protein [Verrucomicrobiae bacterium]
MFKQLKTWLCLALTLLSAVAVQGQSTGFNLISWADWTSDTVTNPGGSVSGSINVAGNTIQISYSGEVFNQTQTNGPGIDYYTPVSTYTNSAVPNPPLTGMITLVGPDTNVDTITFSSPVTNPIIAIVSMGGVGDPVSFNFTNSFTILTSGPGWWATGAALAADGDTLEGNDSDGLIQFTGTFSTLSFTVTGSDRYYTGFTIGAANPLAPIIDSVQGANGITFQGDPSWSFAASGTGAGPLTNQWEFGSTTLMNQGRISGAQSNVLTITNLQTSDSGTYQLTVSNAYGMATSNFTFTVLPDSDYNLFAPYAQTITNYSGLLGYWRFDPVFGLNSCVNGFTGQAQGNASISAPGTGSPMYQDPYNQCLLLDGASGFLSTSLTGQITNQGSMLAWVYLTAQPSTAGHIFSVVNQSQSGNNFDLQIETDNLTRFYPGGSSANAVYTQALPLNQWEFLAATLDTSGNGKIYLNGQLVATVTGVTHFANNNPVSIGESPVFTGRFFQGGIDEVAIYNVALTPAQIAAAFQAAEGVPNLSITSAQNSVTVGWPTNFAGFTLQTNGALNSPNWVSIPTPYSVSGTNFAVTNSLNGSSLFFRLAQ